MTIPVFLLVVAMGLFGMAALGIGKPQVNVMALGLVFLTAALLAGAR